MAVPRLTRVFALSAGIFLLAAALRADKPAEEFVQDTRTEIKFTVPGKPSDVGPLRYALSGVRRDGKEVSLPANAKLDGATGAFAWTPTPSQAGVYGLTFTVTDAAGKEVASTVKVTVRPRAISADKGPIGKLLLDWHKDGTAAGNTGDFFDNRDRDHSPLKLDPYPQLDQIAYTADERKANKDWAMQRIILPHITFGNSSTSAGATQGGSNVRSYYTHPLGLRFIHAQYRLNNLYMYPAHHDHHPGHNGKPFYGDLFPTNTPYVIMSQGSSYTDQPFMKAVPVTLAAFHPEVKQKLADAGLLMPTVQMIFRSCNKHLADPKEYLTGKAHPTVFEGSWVDAEKMVRMAHDMKATDVPALVQMRVVDEDDAVLGKDHFDVGFEEKIYDTPCAIARIVRGGQQVRRLVVSAEDSVDLNGKPLTYQWQVLRGDASRITIKPLNETGSIVEIRVAYHERRPVAGAPLKIDSNRVDIGAFVHNGTYHSAPGFVTFYTLDNEARAYDDKGRLLERAFGVGETDLAITDWNAAFDTLKAEGNGLAIKLLKAPFQEAELAVLAKAGEEYRAALAKQAEAQGKSKTATDAKNKAAADLKVADTKLAEAKKANQKDDNEQTRAALKEATATRDAAADASKKADVDAQAAQKEAEAARKATEDVLNLKRDGLALPAKAAIEGVLQRLKQDAAFAVTHAKAMDELLQGADAGRKGRVAAARKRLIGLGVAEAEGEGLQWKPLRAGSLTAFERGAIDRYQGELLAALVYPKFLTSTFKVNFVDQRIYAAKDWRDVYRHAADGTPLGWTRYDGAEPRDFNPEGELVLDRDPQGRPRKTRTMRYELDEPVKRNFPVVVKPIPGDTVLHYEYANDADLRGKVVRREQMK